MSHRGVVQLLSLGGASPVLAHGADPIAIIGFFGPALLLVAIVVGAVVYDRKRHGPERQARRAEQERGVTRPGAD